MKVVESWRFEIPFSSGAFSSPLPSKALLPSSGWLFFPVFFFVFLAALFLAGSAHDEPFAEPTQMPLLQ
jgi:hypothetical protein